MCIEFLHSEVVNFLNYNSLFTLNLKDRTITLYEDGFIDEESTELSKKQIFNKEILYTYQISPLIKNIYLESKIKEITGNDIKIIDHPDSEITGFLVSHVDTLYTKILMILFLKYAQFVIGKQIP